MNATAQYLPVPVVVAMTIADQFAKDIVIVISWDRGHQHLHTTTFGRAPEDKMQAAALGEILAAAAGCDLAQAHSFEDFRLDAARLKSENDRLTARVRELEGAQS